MFPWKGDSSGDKLRFANLDTAEVQTALDTDKLSEYQVKLISIEQIKGLDFSTMSQKMVNMFFSLYSVDALREEHSYLGGSRVIKNGKVVENKPFGRHCIYSEEELQKKSGEQKQKNDKLFSELSPKQQQDLEPRLYQKDNSADNSSNRGSSQPQFGSFSSLFEDFFS